MNRLTEEMKQEIRSKLGVSDAVIEERDVTKNNGVTLHGVSVRKPNETIAPTIYIDNVDDADLVDYIVTICKKDNPGKEFEGFNVNDVISRENILETVYPVLVNKEKNMKLFTTICHEPYVDDLEIIFKIPVNMKDDSTGAITIRTDILDHCKISNRELYDAAMINIMNTAKVSSMFDTMREIMLNDFRLNHPDMSEDEVNVLINATIGCQQDQNIMVITNERKYLGASVILDEAVLVELKDKLGDFYILPSSIHELLVVPAEENTDISELRNMVREVNDTQVAPDEILSYNVYMYKDGKVSVA